MDKKITRHLMSVAYHEAGHAVASFALGLRFGITTIVPDEKSFGHHVIKLPKRFKPKGRDLALLNPADYLWIDHRVISTFAGSEAEKLFTGRYNHIGGRMDYSSALTLAMIRYSDSKEIGLYLRLQAVCAKNLVSTWRLAIDAVARALFEKRTLQPSEVQAIIRESVLSAPDGASSEPK